MEQLGTVRQAAASCTEEHARILHGAHLIAHSRAGKIGPVVYDRLALSKVKVVR